ncbi:hypothetical protein [Microcoleus sp. B4-D4]
MPFPYSKRINLSPDKTSNSGHGNAVSLLQKNHELHSDVTIA